MSECTQSLMDRKDKVICDQTLRILELEDELASAWASAEYYEIGLSRLAERCLKAEGREATADEYVALLKFAHGGGKDELELVPAAETRATK